MRSRVDDRLPSLTIAVALAALLHCGFPAQGQEAGPGAFRQAVADAEASLLAGEAQLAESHYRTALFEGWSLIGSLERASGNLVSARAAYERAVLSAAEVRSARISLATVLREMGEFESAEQLLRLLIARDKNDFEARRLLADTLNDAGRHEESVAELEQLVYLNTEDLETFYYLATAYLGQGRPDDADRILSEIARVIPSPRTHILIGRTYRDSDEFERARRAFEQALELDPAVPRANYYRGTVDLLDKGQEVLEEAMIWFEKELEINPDDGMANLYLGMALVEGRRQAEAIPFLERAAKTETIVPDALQFLGRALVSERRLEEAIAVLRQGLEAVEAEVADPAGDMTEQVARQISSFHYQLATALRRTGDRDGAAVHFDRAKEFQLKQKETAQDVLDRYLGNEAQEDGEGAGEGTVTEGEAMVTEAVPAEPVAAKAVAPENEELSALKGAIEAALARTYLNLGILKVRAGEARRAANLFQQAAAIDPEMPNLQYSLGVARFNAGQFELATEPLSRALESKPGDGKLEQMLALSWFNLDEYEKAAGLLRELPARHVDRGLEYAYGLALVRSGSAAEAEEVFAGLLIRNADWPELNVVLAQAHAQQGDFNAAVELLERSLVLDPRVLDAHGTLGEIHMRKGELDEAERELRSELEIQPADSRTMFTLATVLDMAQRPEQSSELLRALLGLDPRLGKARYLLGKILLAQGALEDAREQLEAAASLSPEDANIYYQLGQAYQKLGRREEARAQFDIFRQLKNERR